MTVISGLHAQAEKVVAEICRVLAGGRKAGSELGADAHGELWMRGHGDG